MASALCQAYPTFYSYYNAKSLFISVSENFFEWFNVTQDYSVSNHLSFCPVENCKFQLVLIGSSLDQILQRLDKYPFTYKLDDCIYTLYKNRFYSNIISSRGEVFIQLNRAVKHNLKCRIPQKLPSVAKKYLKDIISVQKSPKDIISLCVHSDSWISFLEKIRKV